MENLDNFSLEELIELIGTTGDKPVFKFLSKHCKRINDTKESQYFEENGYWTARARTNERNGRKWVNVSANGNTMKEALINLYYKLSPPHQDI